MNNWIGVKDRLPEDGEYVLCWYEYRAMKGTHEGEMIQTYGIGYYYDHLKFWGGEVSNGVDAKVLYWCPLPQPPKNQF